MLLLVGSLGEMYLVSWMCIPFSNDIMSLNSLTLDETCILGKAEAQEQVLMGLHISRS